VARTSTADDNVCRADAPHHRGQTHQADTQLALYADDTALFTQSWRTDTIARRLTSAIDTLHRYFTKWKLRVNGNKTEAMLFTKRRPAAPPQPQFQHTVIPWSPSIRYLGLTLDSKLPFTKHLHAVTHKATGAFLQLFTLLARDSTLSLHNKLTLYKLLWRFSSTFPPSCPPLNVILTQQTHSLQATDTPYNHLCCPRLEQHITF
jgi:hypothetical protein